MEGGNVGSAEFTFIPGSLESMSTASLDLGTAGSITLVLQAVVPSVALSKTSMDLELTGGTDVPWSPTSDYINEVLRGCLRQLGISFTMEIARRGYYPRGGGKARVHIEPCAEVEPLVLTSRRRDPNPPISIVSRAGSLPGHVAERQAAAAASWLARGGLRAKTTSVYAEDSLSPGTSILISLIGDSCFIGSDSIGAKGKPAERVGSEAAAGFVRTYDSPACLDANLADMVAPLLCMARRPSSFVTSQATSHLRTSLQVAAKFVDVDYSVAALEDGGALVSIRPGQQNI